MPRHNSASAQAGENIRQKMPKKQTAKAVKTATACVLCGNRWSHGTLDVVPMVVLLLFARGMLPFLLRTVREATAATTAVWSHEHQRGGANKSAFVFMNPQTANIVPELLMDIISIVTSTCEMATLSVSRHPCCLGRFVGGWLSSRWSTTIHKARKTKAKSATPYYLPPGMILSALHSDVNISILEAENRKTSVISGTYAKCSLKAIKVRAKIQYKKYEMISTGVGRQV